MATIDRDSQEIRVFSLEATDETGTAVDITGDLVEIAFKTGETRPQDSDWVTCARSAANHTLVEVRFNMSGNSFNITTLGGPGYYQRYVRITDSPERIVYKAATGLTVT